MHELGHTFGFAHNTDYTSIMYRGFDTWNRFFMTSEPPSDASDGIPQIQDSDLPHALVAYETMWLAYSPWFTQVPRVDPGGAVTITQSGDTVTVASPNKIRDIIFWDDNLTFDADLFDHTEYEDLLGQPAAYTGSRRRPNRTHGHGRRWQDAVVRCDVSARAKLICESRQSSRSRLSCRLMPNRAPRTAQTRFATPFMLILGCRGPVEPRRHRGPAMRELRRVTRTSGLATPIHGPRWAIATDS